MQTAILYCRVSTREQAETGHSLEAQEMLLRAYATQKGLHVVGVLAVPESASGARERRHFSELMARLKREKINHLLTEKVDRLSRNFKEAILVQDWLDRSPARHVHFVKQSLVIGHNSRSTDTLMWDISLSIARQYSRNLSEEVKKGQAVAVGKGCMPSSNKIGYRSPGRHGVSAKGKAKTPDPALAPTIRETFERIASGEATSDVWRWVRDGRRIWSASGTPLNHSRFYSFLRDPFVCGQFIFNGQLFEGAQQPIISKKLFYEVQDILDGRKNRKLRRHRYLFDGLLCDGNGARMHCSTNKGIAYYRSPKGGAYTREDTLDQQVCAWFASLKLTDAFIEKVKDTIQQVINTKIDAEKDTDHFFAKRLNELGERKQRVISKLSSGVMDDEAYGLAMADIEMQRRDILKALPERNECSLPKVEPIVFVLKCLKKLPKIYPRLPAEAKRDIARLFFVELVVREGKLYFKAKKEVETLLSLPQCKTGVPSLQEYRTALAFCEELVMKRLQTISAHLLA